MATTTEVALVALLLADAPQLPMKSRPRRRRASVVVEAEQVAQCGPEHDRDGAASRSCAHGCTQARRCSRPRRRDPVSRESSGRGRRRPTGTVDAGLHRQAPRSPPPRARTAHAARPDPVTAELLSPASTCPHRVLGMGEAPGRELDVRQRLARRSVASRGRIGGSRARTSARPGRARPARVSGMIRRTISSWAANRLVLVRLGEAAVLRLQPGEPGVPVHQAGRTRRGSDQTEIPASSVVEGVGLGPAGQPRTGATPDAGGSAATRASQRSTKARSSADKVAGRRAASRRNSRGRGSGHRPAVSPLWVRSDGTR